MLSFAQNSRDFVPAEASKLVDAFARQPQWDGVGGIPFQVSIALHAVAEDLGCSVGVALSVLLWESPGFPGRTREELDKWLNSEEASEFSPRTLGVLAETAVPLGRPT